MSSSIYKIKTIILLHLILMCGVLSGCKDDFTIETIGEGEAMVACEVNFVPLVSALGSRSEGNAIKNITRLDVLIYDSNDNYVDYFPNIQTNPSWEYYESGNNSMPGGSVNSNIEKDDNDNASYSKPEKAEISTPKAKFTLPRHLPYGRYHIYAVANVDLIAKGVDVEDIDAVKKFSLDWIPGDIPSNNAMFGYFTSGDNTSGGADKFDAPLLTVNQRTVSLHSWIKRAASKVTIAFDGTALNNDVHIYVKSVTLKNIPINCFLGQENSPKVTATVPADKLFYNPGENLLPNHGGNLESGATESVVDNSRMFYNKSIKGINNETDDIIDPGTDYTEWMEIINSGGNKGIYGSSHSETADALYFYENNQGDYEGEFAYDKRQYKGTGSNGVGTNITGPANEGEDPNDFRDKVPDGTYVEVQAYYVSNNPANFSSGPIRYRFMLGKNITYNYNAERNHHFKLTLGFKGWANQPDWHIEYDEPDPGLEVPETFRVSYVYNQSHTLPIRVRGLCTKIEMEILENNWAPCDDNGNTLTNSGATSGLAQYDPTAFRWAYQVYQDQQNRRAPSLDEVLAPETYNCTGFLALQVNSDASGNIATNIISDKLFSARTSAVKDLNDYYTGKTTGIDQHYRIFEGNDLSPEPTVHPSKNSSPLNGWEVENNGANDITLLVPLFTRNKSMINGSNYSGNNPFEEYDRYAKVRVTATFKDGTKLYRDINVLQTRRLVNPKGIWRTHGNITKENFTVRLSTKDIGAAYSAPYKQLKSEGSWKAYIEPTGKSFFTLVSIEGSDTTHYKVNADGTEIMGKTDTDVIFEVDFGTATASSNSLCGIITVLYHGNNCVHKIMVRQGFNDPIDVMGDGREWSSFSVFGAKQRQGSTAANPQYDVELTLNPLALGTLFRRGHDQVEKGILVSNNGGTDVMATGPYSNFPSPFGAYKSMYDPTNAPNYGGRLRIYSNPANREDSEPRQTWGTIGFVNQSGATRAASMGAFYATVNNVTRKYRVPTFADFQSLDNAEYAYGVLYGHGATDTQFDPNMAFGFIDPENDDEGTDMGMRGVFVYNPNDGNQIFFPIGKYGIGRRRMFNLSDTNKPISPINDETSPGELFWRGTLWYGDTNKPLTLTGQDWYRPLAYNVCFQQGAIYWIDRWVETTLTGSGSSMGWDMNYYGFDFSAYTANNWQDACPIKLIVDDNNNN